MTFIPSPSQQSNLPPYLPKNLIVLFFLSLSLSFFWNDLYHSFALPPNPCAHPLRPLTSPSYLHSCVSHVCRCYIKLHLEMVYPCPPPPATACFTWVVWFLYVWEKERVRLTETETERERETGTETEREKRCPSTKHTCSFCVCVMAGKKKTDPWADVARHRWTKLWLLHYRLYVPPTWSHV